LSSADLRSPRRKNRVLFINAVNRSHPRRAQKFSHGRPLERIATVYREFKNEPGFARVATLEEIRKQDGNLNIPMYVAMVSPTETNISTNGGSVSESLAAWLSTASDFHDLMLAINRKGTRPPNSQS
jgi:type I restriction enzyme M protein